VNNFKAIGNLAYGFPLSWALIIAVLTHKSHASPYRMIYPYLARLGRGARFSAKGNPREGAGVPPFTIAAYHFPSSVSHALHFQSDFIETPPSLSAIPYRDLTNIPNVLISVSIAGGRALDFGFTNENKY
jgi:hypothetical protein